MTDAAGFVQFEQEMSEQEMDAYAQAQQPYFDRIDRYRQASFLFFADNVAVQRALPGGGRLSAQAFCCPSRGRWTLQHVQS